MAANSAIEWTDATWNPVVGCSIVSPGCTNCYAMRMAARLQRMGMPHYASLTQPSKAGPVWTGEVALAPAHILQAPLGWKKPKRIFVNSMGDLFHESIPDEWIDKVFAVMACAGNHTFQILTKRAVRMRNYIQGLMQEQSDGRERIQMQAYAISRCVQFEGRWLFDLPLPNVWLGVSAERQQEADERIPLLLQTPAAVRFVSAEPLLGKVDMHRWMLGWGGGDVAHCENCGHGHGFTRCPNTGGIAPTAIRNNIKCTGFRRKTGWGGLDWIIVGGESGPHARPMETVWAESLRDQCRAAEVPFFFKQMARKAPIPASLMVREFPR